MAQKSTYARRKSVIATDGSLALNLNATTVGTAGSLERGYVRPRPVRQEVAKTKTAALPKAKMQIPVATVIGFVAVAVLMLGVLYSYIQLTEVSHAVVTLEKQIATLQDDQMALKTRYELTFDFSTVKKAAEAAGMQKITSGQIYYVDMTDADTATAYEEVVSLPEKIWNSLSSSFFAVIDFFR